jgi:cytochrome c oxidase subunit 2
MKVDLYERAWMWLAAVLIAAFLGAIVVAAGVQAVRPPSHVETIDPESVYDSEEFSSPGVEIRPDGSVRVTMVAQMFFFDPPEVAVPAGRPVTFRVTSPDVIHGLEIVGTNANAMVIPGYVSEFSVTFHEPGEYLMVCHEYCGTLHHEMQGLVIVEEDDGGEDA